MKVLHVGCGTEKIDPYFNEWEEIRYDINPGCKPHIVGSILDMKKIEDHSMDAVYTSHVLEHLYAHEAPIALKEMWRVLKPAGMAVVIVPDIQYLGEKIGRGELEDKLYMSDAGPISVCDVLWGYRPALAKGNIYMAHKFGYTKDTLGKRLSAAGFETIKVRRTGWDLVAQAYVS